MNPLLIYMIKAAFSIAVFYLVFTFLLSKDTMYGRNRFFILFAVLSSLIFPLITIETNEPVSFLFFGKTLSDVLITTTSNVNLAGAVVIAAINWPKILFIIYAAGVLLFTAGLIMNLAELLILIRNRDESGSNIIRFQGLNTAGFTAIGYVFINSRLSKEDAEEILKHEQNHLARFHFFDILFMEIIKTLQWFNPFIHMFDRSLRAIHEYQADEGCLKNGVCAASYQQLLLSQVFGSKNLYITNSFSNPTLIKKRMIMMTKKRSTTMANLKLLLVMPVIAIVLFAFSSCGDKGSASAQMPEADKKVVLGDQVSPDAPPPPPPPAKFNVKDGDTTWSYVDKMPVFAGGDAELLKFIMTNTRYPDVAKKNGIMGRVIVKFIVEPDGSVSNISIMKGVSPEIDAESVRVVSLLPKFESPGIEKGKAVPVWYMVPITFSLK